MSLFEVYRPAALQYSNVVLDGVLQCGCKGLRAELGRNGALLLKGRKQIMALLAAALILDLCGVHTAESVTAMLCVCGDIQGT